MGWLTDVLNTVAELDPLGDALVTGIFKNDSRNVNSFAKAVGWGDLESESQANIDNPRRGVGRAATATAAAYLAWLGGGALAAGGEGGAAVGSSAADYGAGVAMGGGSAAEGAQAYPVLSSGYGSGMDAAALPGDGAVSYGGGAADYGTGAAIEPDYGGFNPDGDPSNTFIENFNELAFTRNVPSGGNLSGWLNAGKGAYGLAQSNRLRLLGRRTQAQRNAQGQLDTLTADPASVQNLPGYKAGLQAVERRLAAQGFLGSGNAMTALADYGGRFYNDSVQTLSGLAAPTAQQGQYNMGSIVAGGQGLNSLGAGAYQLWGGGG